MNDDTKSPMRISRFQFAFGAAFVLVFALLYWLLIFESSPLYSYLLNHVEPRNFWMRLHTLPSTVAVLLSGNFHQPSPVGFLVAAAAQWFIVGFLLSLVLTRSRRSAPPEHQRSAS